MLRCSFLTALHGHPLQPLCVEPIKVQPVDYADHAVLAVVGAVDAQLVQQVEQHGAKVTVELPDGGFKAGI